MTDVDDIKKYLKKNLSEKRYKHSIDTADQAKALAKQYGADEESAYLAGLVHDCAKEVKGDEAVRLMTEEYKIFPDSVSVHMPSLLHGPLGACIARSKFGISDEDVLTAIKYHTTGAANMSLLQKIIYIADFTEPNRDFADVEKLRKMSFKDINKAIVYGIDYTISKLIKNGQLIHPDTVNCRNDILMKI